MLTSERKVTDMQVNGRDAHLYEQEGLVTQRTVTAHGITLIDAALWLLAIRGTAIAQLPRPKFLCFDVQKHRTR